MASKRGGAQAPQRCKSGLGTCMVGEIRAGKSFKSSARSCMVKFNNCRGATGGRKSRKGGKRKSRR